MVDVDLPEMDCTLVSRGVTGRIRISHDRRGKFTISVEHDNGFVTSKAPLHVQGAGPGISVDVAQAWIATTDSKGRIEFEAPEVRVNHGRPWTGPAQYRVYLTGLSFFDAPHTPRVLSLGGRQWTICLIETEDTLRKAFKEHGFDTISAVVETDNVTEPDRPALRSAVQVIQWLLSFASGGIVHGAREEIVDGSAPLETVLFAVKKTEPFLLPPVPIMLSGHEMLTKYLESSYAPFLAAAPVYLMKKFLNLLVLTRGEYYLEVKALLVASVFELLRYNYGVNVLVPAGRVTRRDDKFLPTASWGPRPPGANGSLSFAEIMQDFATSMRLRGWTSAFKDLRNQIVHTCEILGATTLDKRSAVMDALHFCDQAALALLDWDRANGAYIPCNQPTILDPKVHGNNIVPFTR